jgi:hypothetical protein
MPETVTLFGHTMCPCGAPVLNEVSYKTGGRCADCFRKSSGKLLDAAMVIVDGRERIVLRSDRSRRKPGVAAQRARARRRKRQDPDDKAHRQLVAACAERARRRLQRLFPELWEVLLADERAKAGLNAWTIDRALTPGEASSSLAWLAEYRRIEQEP